MRLNKLFEKSPVKFSYAGKLFAVVGLGGLIQAVIVMIWFITRSFSTPVVATAAFVLGASAVTTALTIAAVSNLIAPIGKAADALNRFLKDGEVPNLPVDRADKVGQLMADVQDTVARYARSKNELQIASQFDTLTGLVNRTASTDRLRQDLARANRLHSTLSVVVMDIDGFTLLNDNLGNNVGDACLNHVSTIVGTCIREGDWMGRWGADEFILVLWGAPAETTKQIIGRIRRKIASSDSAHEAGIRLTACYGHATHLPGKLDVELLTNAESALHSAKKLGVDTVVGDVPLRGWPSPLNPSAY